MARMVDADALSKLVGEPIEVFLRRLDLKLPPTVDAVEVVRCKDCRYYDAESHNCLDELGYARVWEEDDYCSFAERREDET